MTGDMRRFGCSRCASGYLVCGLGSAAHPWQVTNSQCPHVRPGQLPEVIPVGGLWRADGGDAAFAEGEVPCPAHLRERGLRVFRHGTGTGVWARWERYRIPGRFEDVTAAMFAAGYAAGVGTWALAALYAAVKARRGDDATVTIGDLVACLHQVGDGELAR